MLTIPLVSEPLIGFACGHVYHVSHLLDENTSSNLPTPPQDPDDDFYGLNDRFTRRIGTKVTSARLLKDRIEAVGGCKICRERRLQEEDS